MNIGIIGGGQLGKMMILEAKRLGFYIAVLDPDEFCPASSICDKLIISDFDDPSGYYQLAKYVQIITYEFEHINVNVLEELEQSGHIIYPSVKSLKTIQNKYLQKCLLKERDLPVPRFIYIKTIEDILNAGDIFGYPLMLKATTGGYDGKGNILIKNKDDIKIPFSGELMVEEYINFDKEVSVIACRGIDGERVIYPVAENIHSNSILDTTIVPADINETAKNNIMDIANKVMEIFEGVGTFCVEFFIKNDIVYVNEVAPRPHNSGHYTIEGCFANQFENHIRAIVGLPFGCTKLIQPTVMVNLLGTDNGLASVNGLAEAYKYKNVHVHVYGKRESKKGRKMGHFTVVGDTRMAKELKKIIFIGGVI